MSYYVYIVRCEDDSLYTGLCTDPKKRMYEHVFRTAACAKYTRSHRVSALVALWKTGSRSDAARLEAQIKRLRKAQKLALIAAPDALSSIFGEKLCAAAYTATAQTRLPAYFPLQGEADFSEKEHST